MDRLIPPPVGLPWLPDFARQIERLIRSPRLTAYTVATVPSAAANPYAQIFVTDEVGGAVPAFSDGTNWRRVTDRAIVS
jgi:hypothetical protein